MVCRWLHKKPHLLHTFIGDELAVTKAFKRKCLLIAVGNLHFMSFEVPECSLKDKPFLRSDFLWTSKERRISCENGHQDSEMLVKAVTFYI